MKSALVREALKALIEREAARRFAPLGGTEPDLKAIPRRRTETEVIILDPSVWIEIVRSADTILAALLDAGEDTRASVQSRVSFRLSNFRQRETLCGVAKTPQAVGASHPEVMELHRWRTYLFGRGIGYVDADVWRPRG